MSIVEFIESLKNDITNSDILIKEKGLLKLADYLSKLSFHESNSESVDSLVEFYINISSVHYDILPTILKGLLIIIDFVNFTDSNAKLIAAEIVKLDVAQLNITTRLKIYELLYQLFSFHIEALKSLDKKFLLNFINAVDGESSPNCVLMVLKLNKIIAENLIIDEVYEEYFETISMYFPIEFKANKSTSGQLTRDVLVALNKQCMIANPLFGPHLFPILLEKLTSDKKSARLDSLDIFADAVDRMRFNDVLNYYISFLELLYLEFKNQDLECQKVVLKCLDRLSKVFQERANEKDLLEYCWQLFDKLNGILDDHDLKSLQFLQACIGGQSRIWAGVMGYMLPPLIEKAMKSDLENTQLLNIIASLLSITVDWPRYKGIINESRTKAFFTRLDLLFDQLIGSAENSDNKNRIVHVFRLLGQFSLFEAWIPLCGEEVNFVTDPKIIELARCRLVSKAIMMATVEGNVLFGESIISIVPLMLKSSLTLCGQDNELIKTIVEFTNSQKSVREFSFKLLSMAPIEYLLIVLNVIEKKLNTVSDLEMTTLCLYEIVVNSSKDPKTTGKLYSFIKNQLQGIIDIQLSLSDEVVTNVAMILTDIGEPDLENLKFEVINMLLNSTRNSDFSQPCLTWLCALLGQSSIQDISNSIKISSLINWYFAIMLGIGNCQIKSMLYQNYASVINKINIKEIENDFNDHLKYFNNDVTFLLWNLKACMMGCHTQLTNQLINILTDKDRLSGDIGVDLLKNIEILFRHSGKKHFVSEDRLFPNQNIFYEQQSYQLICKSFQRLANDSKSDESVKEISMGLYLKMIANYSKSLIDLHMEEIASTVSQWFVQLATIPNRVNLTIEALKAICNLSFTDKILSKYSEDIAKNIIDVSKSIYTLELKDRLFLAKVIGWFITTFPKYDTTKYKDSLKTSLSILRKDNKGIVRKEAAKSNILMFCQ